MKRDKGEKGRKDSGIMKERAQHGREKEDRERKREGERERKEFLSTLYGSKLVNYSF